MNSRGLIEGRKQAVGLFLVFLSLTKVSAEIFCTLALRMCQISEPHSRQGSDWMWKMCILLICWITGTLKASNIKSVCNTMSPRTTIPPTGSANMIAAYRKLLLRSAFVITLPSVILHSWKHEELRLWSLHIKTCKPLTIFEKLFLTKGKLFFPSCANEPSLCALLLPHIHKSTMTETLGLTRRVKKSKKKVFACLTTESLCTVGWDTMHFDSVSPPPSPVYPFLIFILSCTCSRLNLDFFHSGEKSFR